MNSLKALKIIFINCKNLLVDENYNVVKLEDLIKIIKQDLECLEKLAKNYNDLIWKYNSLECKNERLVQALGKIEDILTDKYDHKKYPFPDDVVDAISDVIQEVFTDDKTS